MVGLTGIEPVTAWQVIPFPNEHLLRRAFVLDFLLYKYILRKITPHSSPLIVTHSSSNFQKRRKFLRFSLTLKTTISSSRPRDVLPYTVEIGLPDSPPQQASQSSLSPL